jgi:hypothetical protein
VATPQACAWSLPSERWRSYTVAMWVRTAVICESSDATAADKNSLHRFADQIGLTTAGLAEMGWKVAVDEVAERRSAEPEAPRERRLRAVLAMGASDFLVDFPSLGDLIDGWVEQHCRVPDGFARKQPFRMSDWQFWITANHYRVRDDAAWEPARPLLNQAFHYRRSLVVARRRPAKARGPRS